MDQSSLVHWKSLIHEVVGGKKMEMNKFLNLLTDQSMALGKRDGIQNNSKSLGSTVANAEKVRKIHSPLTF